MCVFLCLSLSLPVCVPVCLSVCLSVCPLSGSRCICVFFSLSFSPCDRGKEEEEEECLPQVFSHCVSVLLGLGMFLPSLKHTTNNYRTTDPRPPLFLSTQRCACGWVECGWVWVWVECGWWACGGMGRHVVLGHGVTTGHSVDGTSSNNRERE